MPDITHEQGRVLGADALTLMLNLMSRNRRENEQIRTDLYDSVQRDLAEARAQIGRIRRNVAIVIARPHTDQMVADALYAALDYEDPDARA